MAIPMVLPDGFPLAGVATLKDLEPDVLLSRIFNHEDAAMNGYTGLSWNTRKLPVGSPVAGRFDLLPSEPGGFLYGSESDADRRLGSGCERVAILETFRSAMMTSRDPNRGNRRVMSRSFRNARSVQRFQVRTPLSLVCIRTQRGREPFRMEEEVLHSPDRDATRAWGDYVRSQVPDASGIAYNSTRETSTGGLCSFVLWEDRVPAGAFDPIETIPLGTPPGRKIVDEALLDYAVLWN